MADEPGTKDGTDGTTTTPVITTSGDGDGAPKMVKESDLLAIKANLTKTVDDLGVARLEVTRLTDLAATHQSAATTAQAKVAELSPLEQQIADSVKNLGAEKARADAAVSALSTSQTDLLDLRKTNLTTKYGVEAEKLEGKTLAELANYEEALALIPTNGTGGSLKGRLDGGGNGGGSETISARQSIAAGLSDGETLGPLGIRT